LENLRGAVTIAFTASSTTQDAARRISAGASGFTTQGVRGMWRKLHQRPPPQRPAEQGKRPPAAKTRLRNLPSRCSGSSVQNRV